MLALNNTLDQMDLTFHEKATEYIFISSAHGMLFGIGHMLGHKTSFNKFKKISDTFSEHNGMKIEINYKKKTRKFTNTWRLNNILLKTNGSK